MLASRVSTWQRPLLSQRNRAASIKAYHVKRVLADIDTHHSDCGVELLGHGVLPLLVAPRQLCLPAGQERGRTIPVTSITALQKGGRYRINSGQTARRA